ncbi:GAF and ANTAR domain-containing protein [Parasphingorhabdus pacifica]
MVDELEVEELATSLANMARQLLAHGSVNSTLDGIVEQAVSRLDGCETASIMVLNADRTLGIVASTSELGRESDRIQAELGEGPCFDAADKHQEVFRVADMGSNGERWPRYAPKARALGIGSMMGFLLFTTRESLGALNLYSSRSDAFTKRDEQVGWIFASHAAVAFASARNDAQLHEAIATRQGIGEAMGIIMHRYKVPEDQAFEVLKRVSQSRNIKLRDIARQVVETGDVPQGGGR